MNKQGNDMHSGEELALDDLNQVTGGAQTFQKAACAAHALPSVPSPVIQGAAHPCPEEEEHPSTIMCPW